MEREKKDIALNIKIESSTIIKVDKIAKEVDRSRSQIVRMIINKYFDQVEQGITDPVK